MILNGTEENLELTSVKPLETPQLLNILDPPRDRLKENPIAPEDLFRSLIMKTASTLEILISKPLKRT